MGNVTRDSSRYTMIVGFTAAAADVLPWTYAAVVRGTQAEVEAVVERINAHNQEMIPGAGARTIPWIEVDAADAFDEIMAPF